MARMGEEPKEVGGDYGPAPDSCASVGSTLSRFGQRNAFVEEFVGRERHVRLLEHGGAPCAELAQPHQLMKACGVYATVA